MSNVTREEVIELLRNFQQRMAAKRGMCDEHDGALWDNAESVIAALQAVEPAAWQSQQAQGEANHWAVANPGLADQYRQEAFRCRNLLGFSQCSNEVSPNDLGKAICDLQANALPAPAAVPDERSHLIALLGVMCGWFEDLAKIAGWTPDNANAAWAGYRAAKAAIAPSRPAPAAVPDEAFNLIEAIRAELTWPGWRKTSSRDWVMDMVSELLSMLIASPHPAETEEKSRD